MVRTRKQLKMLFPASKRRALARAKAEAEAQQQAAPAPKSAPKKQILATRPAHFYAVMHLICSVFGHL